MLADVCSSARGGRSSAAITGKPFFSCSTRLLIASCHGDRGPMIDDRGQQNPLETARSPRTLPPPTFYTSLSDARRPCRAPAAVFASTPYTLGRADASGGDEPPERRARGRFGGLRGASTARQAR